MQLDQNTCLYLFSALLQADATIISIVGIFIIFKVQSLQSQIETIKNYLHDTRHGDLLIEYESNPETKSKILNNPGNVRFIKMHGIEQRIESYESKVVFPTILLVLAMIIDIIGIVFSKTLHHKAELFYPTLFISIYHVVVYIMIAAQILIVIKGNVAIEKLRTMFRAK